MCNQILCHARDWKLKQIIIELYALQGDEGDTPRCRRVLHNVTVCCSVLQCVVRGSGDDCDALGPCLVLNRVVVCCSMLQCVAVHCSVLQHVAACLGDDCDAPGSCSVLQCVAMRCSVLQCVACVAVCCSVFLRIGWFHNALGAGGQMPVTLPGLAYMNIS